MGFLRLFGKSVFPGKTYNEILAQNRACEFNFADPLYSKISPLGRFYLQPNKNRTL